MTEWIIQFSQTSFLYCLEYTFQQEHHLLFMKFSIPVHQKKITNADSSTKTLQEIYFWNGKKYNRKSDRYLRMWLWEKKLSSFHLMTLFNKKNRRYSAGSNTRGKVQCGNLFRVLSKWDTIFILTTVCNPIEVTFFFWNSEKNLPDTTRLCISTTSPSGRS